MEEQPEIIVLDNASADHTAAMVSRGFPSVRLLTSPCNAGASARNLAVEAVGTPHVAFCDDDSWWAHGSFEAAAKTLAAYPHAPVCAQAQGLHVHRAQHLE